METTSQGVELALVRAFTGLRLVNLIQLALALGGLIAGSPRPALDVVLAAAFVLESVTVISLGLHRADLRSAKVVWCDVAFGVVLLAGQTLIAMPGHRLNVWDAWGYPVTLSCAMVAGMMLPVWQASAATTALWVTYLWGTLHGAAGLGQQWTALTNCLGYVAFALIGGASAGYLRRLSRAADTARDMAARAGAEAEMERHRRMLHDHASLLSMIGANAGDTQLQAALRLQAVAAAATVSSFLASTPAVDAALPETLAEVLRTTAAQFPDLSPTVNVDLVEHVRLTPAVRRAVAGAVSTLLHNVRAHAHAYNCTIHADSAPDGSDWEVSVRDDGVGFDPVLTPPGYGLARQVRAAAAEAGIGVRVATSPGAGTTVTLSTERPGAVEGHGAQRRGRGPG
ncbi:hypothetical protein ABEG17_08440 [Pedococcus sp. KACC 23699]|uniref:Histidine kinase/HSP90-like ATPase domain-containing protein n=1 Tax=Pedococcus sp. KACC 23699 TaxID=3149228 RepID=A0AAU7JZ58_9MICO